MATTKTTPVQTAAVPLAALHPAPWNPRTIKDERFQNLCQSIQADPEFLWRRPVLAQADGTIYAGNMRYRAAQHLGLETIPAIIEDIPDQLARERALRDNAQWGEWEEDDLAKLLDELRDQGSNLDLLGFDDRELQQLLNRLENEGGLTDPDAIPEPITKPGDLGLLGNHRVLSGDSTNTQHVEIVMNGEKARLMATDPPYLVNYTGGNHPDSKANRPETKTKDWDAYKDPETAVQFYIDFLEAALPHFEERAPIYQWHANTRQALVDEAWRRTGLLAHQVIIWVKSRGVLTHSHYMWQHEPAMYGWKEGKQPGLKPPANMTTVWSVDQKSEQDGIHPTQKGVELFKRPLLYHTKPGDLCFEPFLGSGTCLIAAEAAAQRLGVEGLIIDVTNEADVATFFERTGRFDHLVFTAGDWGTMAGGSPADWDIAGAGEVFAVRFWGAVAAIKHGHRSMPPGGSITLTDGVLAHRPRKGVALNTAMLGAIEHLVRGLAVELAPLRVNAVCPGLVLTEALKNVPEDQLRKMTGRLPVPRPGDPAEIAEAYLYLMRGTYTTGQVLRVDGGYTLV